MDTYDLSIYQGQTFSLSLTVRDINGVPLNLSGYGLSGYLKTRYGDTVKLVDLGAQITNQESGIIVINIPATGTAALPVNYAFYDIEISNSGTNEVLKVLAGKASIFPEVTY